MTTTVQSSDALAEAAAAAPPPAAVASVPREPITIALTIPIDAHGETRTSLTLRVPKPEDLEAVDFYSGKRTTRTWSDLLMRLAGIPRSSVLQLDPVDYVECLEAVGGFLLKRAPTS